MSHSSYSSSPVLEFQAAKRSCMSCRKRQTQCDGRIPRCGQCSMSMECKYPKSSTPNNIDWLEYDAGRLERRIQDVSDRRSSDIKNSSSSTRPQNLSFSESEMLLHSFLSSHMYLGLFFLDEEAIKAAARLPAIGGSHFLPTPSLMYSIYLWGCCISRKSPDVYEEQAYFKKAVEKLPDDLSSSHPKNILQALQTELLVSAYCINLDNQLEGGYHANNAASLSLAANLHQIQSGSVGLSEESIRGFWLCFSVCNELTSDGLITPFHRDDFQILTPWPLEGGETRIHSNVSPRNLGELVSDRGPRSPLALRAKASILFARAITQARRVSKGSAHPSTLTSLEPLIEGHLRLIKHGNSFIADLVIAESVLLVCLVRLNLTWLSSSEEGRNKCFSAAFRIGRLIGRVHSLGLQSVHPNLANVWMAAVETIFAHVRMSLSANEVVAEVPLATAKKCIEVILECFVKFSERSTLFRRAARQIKDQMASIA